MPKRKPKRRTRKFKEEDFEKWIEKRAEQFGEEMEEAFRRFGLEAEKKTKKKGWKIEFFGPLGPLFGSAAGIIFVAIGIWLLNLINSALGSSFISTVSDFLFSNLHWFFVVGLFFNYNDYFSKKFSKNYWLISPVMSGIAIVIVAWVLGWVFGIVSNYSDASVFVQLSSFLNENLWGILVLVVVLGYVVVFVQKIVMRVWE